MTPQFILSETLSVKYLWLLGFILCFTREYLYYSTLNVEAFQPCGMTINQERVLIAQIKQFVCNLYRIRFFKAILKVIEYIYMYTYKHVYIIYACIFFFVCYSKSRMRRTAVLPISLCIIFPSVYCLCWLPKCRLGTGVLDHPHLHCTGLRPSLQSTTKAQT